MPKNTKSINTNLFQMLKSHGYEPEPLDSSGKKIPVPDEADVFQFKVKTGDHERFAGKKHVKQYDESTVTVSIDENHDLKVYYNSDATKDDNWYNLLKHLKKFAARNQMGFDPVDEDQLTHDMAKRQHMKEQNLKEGKWTHNAKTGAKLNPKTGEELPPKEKPLTMKQMFSEPKKPKKHKLSLDEVWRKVEDVVGQIFPDGDPIDHLAPWLEKHGIRDFKIGEILDRAAKKNGHEDLYDYYDSMKDQYARDNVAEATRAPRTKKSKLFRIDGPQRLRHAMKNAVEELDLSIETQGYSDDSSTMWTIVVHNTKFTSAEQLETAIRGAMGDYQAYLDVSEYEFNEDVAESSKEGKHPNNELGRAQKYFQKHGDADMGFEDIVDMLTDAGFSEEIARDIASDSGRIDEGVAKYSLSEGRYEVMYSNGKVEKFSAQNDSEALKQAKKLAAAKGRVTVKSVIANPGSSAPRKVMEGYYAAGKRASYNDAIPQVKILVQHSRPIEEGEQRFRNVERIFVENCDGERIRVPTTNTAMARTFARLIAEGDKPYGDRWTHLQSLCEEYSKLRGFVRAVNHRELNESVSRLAEACVSRTAQLREALQSLSKHRGYHNYFENWTPSLMESATDNDTITEMLGAELLDDPRISEALDVLGRINSTISENAAIKEVDELAEWADSIIDETVDESGPADEDKDGMKSVMQQIAAGELELYDVMTDPQDNVQKQCSTILKDMYERIAGEQGLHADDDFEEIESYMLDELEDQYGTGEDTPHDDGLRGDDSSIEDLDAEVDQMNAELDAEFADDPAIREMDNRSPESDERERHANSPEGKKKSHKEIQDNLKKTPKKLRDKLRLPDPDEDKDELLNVRNELANARKHFESIVSNFESTEDEVKENLDADQKRAGQLGPTEKIGKSGPRGKLVGANESVDPELAAIRRLSGLK